MIPGRARRPFAPARLPRPGSDRVDRARARNLSDRTSVSRGPPRGGRAGRVPGVSGPAWRGARRRARRERAPVRPRLVTRLHARPGTFHRPGRDGLAPDLRAAVRAPLRAQPRRDLPHDARRPDPRMQRGVRAPLRLRLDAGPPRSFRSGPPRERRISTAFSRRPEGEGRGRRARVAGPSKGRQPVLGARARVSSPGPSGGDRRDDRGHLGAQGDRGGAAAIARALSQRDRVVAGRPSLLRPRDPAGPRSRTRRFSACWATRPGSFPR